MATMTNTEAAAFLKQRFTSKRVENLVYHNNPFFAKVPKDTNFGGENLKVPVMYADLKSGSATFSTALANKSPSSTIAFLITTVSDYALFSVSGQTILQSKGNENAFFEALDRETKSAMNVLSRRTGIGLYRSVTGSIGRLSSTASVAGTTATLMDRAMVTNFEVGMKIVTSDTDGGALHSATTMTVNAVDRDAGTLTLSGNVNSLGAGVGDYIYAEGDRNARIAGLDSWIPSSAPGATSFFGVDRSVDTSRLGGHRISATGLNLEEALIEAAVRCAESGGNPDTVFISFPKWKELINLLGSRKEFVKSLAVNGSGEEVATVGFQGVRIYGPAGTLDVYADQNCQYDTAWVLTLSSWTLHSTGQVPQILGLDDNNILRESSADAYEGRVGAYLQLACNAPGYNCRVTNI